MARDPLAAISVLFTPQARRIPGRADQVRNAAGGYVLGKDPWREVEDFLILGVQGAAGRGRLRGPRRQRDLGGAVPAPEPGARVLPGRWW